MKQQEEITLATKYGFTSIEDSNRGEGWNKFYKDNLHVWQVVLPDGLKWQTAYLIDGSFVKHIHFDNLETAFKRGE